MAAFRTNTAKRSGKRHRRRTPTLSNVGTDSQPPTAREQALTNTRLDPVRCRDPYRLTFQNSSAGVAAPSWYDAGRQAIQAPEEFFRVRGRDRRATARAKAATREDHRRSQQAAEAQRCICTAWLARPRDCDGHLHGTATGTNCVGQQASWQRRAEPNPQRTKAPSFGALARGRSSEGGRRPGRSPLPAATLPLGVADADC